jgi:hypothetical protein
MRTAADEDRNAAAGFELAAGCVAVVGAAFTAAAVFGPAQWSARVLLMAVAAGLVAAVVKDWRASAGVALIAALLFVGFLTHRAGRLTGDPAPWPDTLVIGLAALLGRAVRAAEAARGAVRTAASPVDHWRIDRARRLGRIRRDRTGRAP